jgi:Xaa-Pro aminopeptidase
MMQQKTSRLQKLRQKLVEKELDAILVSQPENMFYLSGCEGLEGYLLVTLQRESIVTDFRYIEQAARQSPECEIFRTAGKMVEWFPKLMEGSALKRMGFEAASLTFYTYQQISETLNSAGMSVELIPLSGTIESLRSVKDKEELDLIKRAVKITDAAYE